MSEDIDDVLGLAQQDSSEAPKDADARELSELAQALQEKRRQIARAEDRLKQLKAEEQKLSGFDIPDKMDELGVRSITLTDGSKLSYKPWYSGKIKPESEPLAFDWLENNGHGGVIKGELTIPWRRPQKDDVLALKDIVEGMGWETQQKLGVHHSTLRALFREIIEGGGALPPDLFDVLVGRKTEIK